MKEESSSSEEEDDDEEEDQQEKASGEEEEVMAVHMILSLLHQSWKRFSKCLFSCRQEEVETFPEERENFLQQLYKFMEDRGKIYRADKLMFT